MSDLATNLTTTVTRTSRVDGTTQDATTVDVTVAEALPQAVHAVAVTVDFGDGSGDAVTTVTGQGWVKSTSRLVASFSGESSEHDPEDALLEGLRVTAGEITAGVGFVVRAHAPDGTHGIYNVHVIGV
jgi:hypothetical protein